MLNRRLHVLRHQLRHVLQTRNAHHRHDHERNDRRPCKSIGAGVGVVRGGGRRCEDRVRRARDRGRRATAGEGREERGDGVRWEAGGDGSGADGGVV
jgi:hypothetical protein